MLDQHKLKIEHDVIVASTNKLKLYLGSSEFSELSDELQKLLMCKYDIACEHQSLLFDILKLINT